MGIGFCCLITCRLHYPAGKATAELPILQFSLLSFGKCLSLGLKHKLFSIIYTAQKSNASFLPSWGSMTLKTFLFVCFTASVKNSSVQQYAKIPEYYTGSVICSWRGSKPRLLQKLHTISSCTVCFPRSPKLFTETIMRQVLG